MKRKLKWFLVGLAVGLAALQFSNPAHTNPPVMSDFVTKTLPPPEITAMAHAACYDCHSHETRWPWYSHVAPLSWQIAQDVQDGRENLDLSDWPDQFPIRAAKKLEDMSEEIQYGDMPPKKYTLIHADARLTASQRKEFTAWLDAEASRLKSTAGK